MATTVKIDKIYELVFPADKVSNVAARRSNTRAAVDYAYTVKIRRFLTIDDDNRMGLKQHEHLEYVRKLIMYDVDTINAEVNRLTNGVPEEIKIEASL